MVFLVMKNEHVVHASTCHLLGPHWHFGGEEGCRKMIALLNVTPGILAERRLSSSSSQLVAGSVS
jgi:hypothetical protein